MLKTRLHKRERERDSRYKQNSSSASRVSPLFLICKEALPLRNGHGRCQRSPKLFAQHIWSLETLDERTLPRVDAGQCAGSAEIGTYFFPKKGKLHPPKAEPNFNALHIIFTHLYTCKFPCSQAAEELPILQD